MAQMVNNLPAMQETWVPSLGLEDPLEKAMSAYSSILAWRIPWTEEPGGLQSKGSQKVRHTEQLSTTLFTPVKSPFPYTATYLQIPGIRMWTSLGVAFCHRALHKEVG